MGILKTATQEMTGIERAINKLRQRLSFAKINLSDELDTLEKTILRKYAEQLNPPPVDPLIPTQEEIDLGINAGKIPAIKKYRERTHGGLAEAKQTLEAYFDKHGLKFKPYQGYQSPYVSYDHETYGDGARS